MSRPGYLVRPKIHFDGLISAAYVPICTCRNQCALRHLKIVCGACGGAIPNKREFDYIRHWVESGVVADTYSEFFP